MAASAMESGTSPTVARPAKGLDLSAVLNAPAFRSSSLEQAKQTGYDAKAKQCRTGLGNGRGWADVAP
jgi:hypothetical protein